MAEWKACSDPVFDPSLARSFSRFVIHYSMAGLCSVMRKALPVGRWLVVSVRLSFFAACVLSHYQCRAIHRSSGGRSGVGKYRGFASGNPSALFPFYGKAQIPGFALSGGADTSAFLHAAPPLFSGRAAESKGCALRAVSAASESSTRQAAGTLFPLGPPPALAPSVASAKTPEAFEAAKAAIETEYWRLHRAGQEAPKKLSETQIQQLLGFAKEYCDAAKVSGKIDAQESVNLMIGLFQQCTAHVGHPFPPFGRRIRDPFDFYSWALSIWKPLIDKGVLLADDSLLKGLEAHVRAGGNVVFLSNHQTEPDPVVLQWMFEQRGFSFLAEKLVAVAGDRVRSDPLSTPFSMGINMICVFSKKHMSDDPAERQAQQKQNMLAMQQLQLLLQTGEGVVWVAPSGGRDRPDSAGNFSRPDSFDAKTVQMFFIHAHKAKDASNRDTLFVPVALFTAPICPPPQKVSHALGESRHCAFASVFAALGTPLPVSIGKDRIIREADAQVQELYQQILTAKSHSEGSVFESQRK